MKEGECARIGNRRWEKFKIDGDQLVKRIKELAHEGTVRRIIIRDEEGQTYMEIPLTVGVMGTVLFPVWAALGALAALLKGFAIEVEREEIAKKVHKASRHSGKAGREVSAHS